jgi:hypothetical protein
MLINGSRAANMDRIISGRLFVTASEENALIVRYEKITISIVAPRRRRDCKRWITIVYNSLLIGNIPFL